jgi:hypothetical protein
VGDIRAQAQTTLKELREAQKELGDDDLGGLLNTYASILENFVRQAPAGPPGAKAPAIKPQPKLQPADEQEE